MPIDPGKLRHLVTLRGETTASDGEGGITSTDAEIGQVRASIEPLGRFERLTAMQADQSITHRVRIRFAEVEDADAVESILHKGRTLRVVGPPVNEDERDAMLTFDCAEET